MGHDVKGQESVAGWCNAALKKVELSHKNIFGIYKYM